MKKLKLFATYKVQNTSEGNFYMMITGQTNVVAKGIVSFGEELDTILDNENSLELGQDIAVLKKFSTFEFVKE